MRYEALSDRHLVMKLRLLFVSLVWLFLVDAPAAAGEVESAPNYREYSALLSSSGQPDAEQLADAAQRGFERVVYLSFDGDSTALDDEDSVVIETGMRFIQLPVDWHAPKVDDFRHFAGIMQAQPDAKTLVHCQVNFRASTFTFLYRVAILGEPLDAAKADLDSVWNPNETWFRFLRDTLEAYDLSYECAGCDWGENEFLDP